MTVTTVPQGEKDLFRIVATVRQLCEGKTNAIGTVTLTANAASTTVSAPTCSPDSQIFLFPTTANAAAIVAATYIAPADVTKEQFIVTHTNNANADKTFWYVVLG